MSWEAIFTGCWLAAFHRKGTMIDHIRAYGEIRSEAEKIGARIEELAKLAEPLERGAITRRRLESMAEAAGLIVRDTGRLMQGLEGEQ